MASVMVMLNTSVNATTVATSNVKPSIGISAPTPDTVKAGGTVTYVINATDDEGVSEFTITSSDISFALNATCFEILLSLFHLLLNFTP